MPSLLSQFVPKSLPERTPTSCAAEPLPLASKSGGGELRWCYNTGSGRRRGNWSGEGVKCSCEAVALSI